MASGATPLVDWAAGQLGALLGSGDRTLAAFVVALATKAATPAQLLGQLADNDVPVTDASKRFAIELFRRAPRRGAAAGAAGAAAAAPRSQADALRASAKYALVLDEPERQALAATGGAIVGASAAALEAQRQAAAAAAAAAGARRDKHLRRRRDGGESSGEEDDDEDNDGRAAPPPAARRRTGDSPPPPPPAGGGGEQCRPTSR